MNNSFFIRSEQEGIVLNKLQICTWDFSKNNSLIEFGFEINSDCLSDFQEINLNLFIPWFKNGCTAVDFYKKLENSQNSKFIFNDRIARTTSLDGGDNKTGVIHDFEGKSSLCILPVVLDPNYQSGEIQITLDLKSYKIHDHENPNIYIRIGIECDLETISTIKKGVGKSTLIYDVKLNESRNIPENWALIFPNSHFCLVQTCFCFHIIPNHYDIGFVESEHLKNVRTLEYQPFVNYLDDKRLERNKLMVVFSKKKDSESYTFFSMYNRELIGFPQFAVAILINIICAFLFALPTFRNQLKPDAKIDEIIFALPLEYYISFILIIVFVVYLFFQPLKRNAFRFWNYTKSRIS